MKRVIIFLAICLVSMNLCFATDCNAVITTSSSINKTDDCVLYSINLEKILANYLTKNFAEMRKFNSLKNKVINITVKYEIKSINSNQNSKVLEKVALISDNTTLRLITKVNLTNVSDNKILWSNVYYKNINFEILNNKNFSPITNYYEKLSQTILDEIKTLSNIRPVDYKQQETTEPQDLPDTTVEIHHVTPKPDVTKKTNIKPQLQLQENLTEKKQPQPKQEKPKTIKPVKQEKPKSTEGFGTKLKNIQLKLKPSTPVKEVKPEDIKTDKKPQSIQPTYTNIHVSPRKNSRDYTPKFDNSVNDI